MKKLVCIIAVLLLMPFGVTAQNRYSGTVLGSDGAPLPGAAVMIEGTTNGTATDTDGRYEIVATSGQTLLVSCIGFSDARKTLGTQTVVDFTLEDDATFLDEVVVVGYGFKIGFVGIE